MKAQYIQKFKNNDRAYYFERNFRTFFAEGGIFILLSLHVNLKSVGRHDPRC